jgi:hypothetical protein
LQAVAEGDAETAVDRLSGRPDPRGQSPKTTSRERQTRQKRKVAEELEIDRDGVGSVDRLDGLDVFLRSPGVDEFDQQLREQAAQDEQFIKPTDLGTDIDPQDLSGQVTGVRQPRRDNVAARRIEANSPYQTLTEDDVTKQSEGGFGVTETKQRSFTASEIASDTALETVDPQADLQPVDSGFGLDLGAERRLVAESTEQSTPLSAVDPQSDVTVVDGEPQLTDRTRKEAGAAQLDEQFPDLDIGVGDVQLEDGQVTFEKEVRR